MNDAEHEYRCPLSAVDRRLADVHQHWHDAERGYFDPERFRIAIQTTIQTLRTVTFILQSNKRLFNNFDSWYESWQQKLRADPLMRWMVPAGRMATATTCLLRRRSREWRSGHILVDRHGQAQRR